MSRLLNRSFFIAIFLFAIGLSFAVGYGYYKKSVAKEQIPFSVAIAGGVSKQTEPVIFNLADQGIPKKWLQPDQVMISNYSIKNEGGEALQIQVKAVNFVNDVILESTSGPFGFTKPSSELTGAVDPGKTFSLKARVTIPDINPNQRQQRLGEIRIIDGQNGSLLGLTPVSLISAATPAATGPQPGDSGNMPMQQDMQNSPQSGNSGDMSGQHDMQKGH